MSDISECIKSAVDKAVQEAVKAHSGSNVVLVRTYSAGVHFGRLERRDGKEVTLTAARRLWNWAGANTLHEIALRGVAAGSKVSEAVPSITLTEAIEVIPMQNAALECMARLGWGK